jgi:hypothetical protein
MAGGFLVYISKDQIVFWLGILTILFGVLALSVAKSEYSVILNTSSGEAEALKSKDREFIENVVSALNQAIIARG